MERGFGVAFGDGLAPAFIEARLFGSGIRFAREHAGDARRRRKARRIGLCLLARCFGLLDAQILACTQCEARKVRVGDGDELHGDILGHSLAQIDKAQLEHIGLDARPDAWVAHEFREMRGGNEGPTQ